MGVHIVAIIALSFYTFATLHDPPPTLYAGPPDGDDYFDDLVEVDFSVAEVETMEVEDVELEFDPTELNEVSLDELDNPWDDAAVGLTDLTPGMTAALPTDLAALAVGESGGQPDASGRRGEQPEGGAPGSAQFFGAKSRGNRFVFAGRQFRQHAGRPNGNLAHGDPTRRGSDDARQSFYVMFYSDQVYPMLYPDPVEEMLPATRDNKRRLEAWLASVEMCLGGQLKPALEMAAELEPSAVFLLSDGDIRSQRTLDFLTADNDWSFALHTLGMTVRDADDAGKLLAIAQAHGGTFTPVGVNPAAMRLARQRVIPYHNAGPGPVWGSRVAKRR